jgi:hypothetical protein
MKEILISVDVDDIDDPRSEGLYYATNQRNNGWYKPVSIDELLPGEHWMNEQADNFQKKTGASRSSIISYLFGMEKVVEYFKTKLK